MINTEYRIMQNGNGTYKIQYKFLYRWWDWKYRMHGWTVVHYFESIEDAHWNWKQGIAMDVKKENSRKWKQVWP